MDNFQSSKVIPAKERQADGVEQFFAPEKKKAPVKAKRRPRKKMLEPEIMIKEDLKKVGFFSRPVFISALAILVVALCGTTGFFFFQCRSLVAQEKSSENESYLYKLKELVFLPEDEEPTIAMVSDKEKLQDQAFFASAENGDKVVLFPKAQKLVLFRPSANKIVEIASLSGKAADQAAAEQPLALAEAASQPESEVLGEEVENNIRPIKVAVCNGTRIKRLAKLTQDKVLGLTGNEAGALGNAIGNYAKTIVIDLKGGQEKRVQEIVELIGGEIGNLPEGEVSPEEESDILIIAGEDQKQ